MSNLAIAAKGLGKKYLIGGPQQQFGRFSEQFTAALTSPFRRAGRLLRGQASGAAELSVPLWALRNIDFEITHGEIVGIIGRNGSGKSTLLRILSRITEPTEGEARIWGRVGSLLEVGTGFHPELTGRENVFLNGAILGMRQREIRGKFDEIVDFAEIEEFIDTPVKHYSSGMYVRLAFAVAAHLEPEVLLVDEVLAVGDVAFQKKSLGKMNDVAGSGRTVLFVSHNMALVQSLCTRGILLDHGHLVIDSDIHSTVEVYITSLEQAQTVPIDQRTDRSGAGESRVNALRVWSEGAAYIRTGGPLSIAADVSRILPNMYCLFSIFDSSGQQIAVLTTEQASPADQRADFGKTYTCHIDELLLVPGDYHITVLLGDGGGRQDLVEGAHSFHVQEGQVQGRPVAKAANRVLVTFPCRWEIPV